MAQLEWKVADSPFVQGQETALNSVRGIVGDLASRNYFTSLGSDSNYVSPEEYYTNPEYADRAYQAQRGLLNEIESLTQERDNYRNQLFQAYKGEPVVNTGSISNDTPKISGVAGLAYNTANRVSQYASPTNVSNDSVSIGSWKRSLNHKGLNVHRDMITRKAIEAGIDPNELLAMANIESGFNQHAQNTNYGGLFQIDKSKHKNWANAEYNTNEAIKLYKQNQRYWNKATGLNNFNAGIAYLLHQQGMGGGVALHKAKDTNMTAAQALSKFYVSNAKRANMSPEAYVNKYVIKSNGGTERMSARDFYNMWVDRGNALQQGYSLMYSQEANNRKSNSNRG